MSTEKKVYISTDYTGEASAPHQYFVTDADGKGKWEEKLAYDTNEYSNYVIVPETEVTTTEADGNEMFGQADNIHYDDFVTGETYIVVMNGTSYECVAQTASETDSDNNTTEIGVGLGNTNLLTGGNDSGEPFAIVAFTPAMVEMQGINAAVIWTNGSSSITISILGRQKRSKTIPSRFLGSGINAKKPLNYQLVTDQNGNSVWEKKPFYSEIGEVTPICKDVLLSAVAVDSLPAQFSMSEPLAENIDPEYVYEVSWGGKTYQSKAVDLTVVTGGVVEMLAIGNLSLAGEEVPVENPAPDAPFVYVYIPSGQEGMYGMMISNIVPETPTISISKFKETVVTIPKKYLPDGLGSDVQQITLTCTEDADTGVTTVTSNVDFETAWAMTDAELQAAITIKQESRFYMYPATYTAGASFISRVSASTDNGIWRMLQIRFHHFMDFGDCMGMSDTTRYIDWISREGVEGCMMSEYIVESLPELTKYTPGVFGSTQAGESMFVVNEFGRWLPRSSREIARSLYSATSYRATRSAEGDITLSGDYSFTTVMYDAINGSASNLILTDSATGNSYVLPLVAYKNTDSEDTDSMTFGATIGTETFLIEWKKAGITSIAQ